MSVRGVVFASGQEVTSQEHDLINTSCTNHLREVHCGCTPMDVCAVTSLPVHMTPLFQSWRSVQDHFTDDPGTSDVFLGVNWDTRVQ